MNYEEFLQQVIDRGIRAARRDYARETYIHQREGSVAGFEACRHKSPQELKELLESSAVASRDARTEEREDYWWYRCYEAEVEWVCNVVSSMLHNQGLPVIIIPTVRGALLAAEIVGVKG